MDKSKVLKVAAKLKQETGGIIFGFPTDENDPFSKYTVVVFSGGKYHVYPEAENIQLAAVGVNTIIECFRKVGKNIIFSRDVRLVSYDAQMKAPDVTMRRLVKGNHFKTLP